MPQTHSDHVHSQFDPQANAYLQSAVHASGPDLRRALELVSHAIPENRGSLLDIGCGAGHLSFALAPALERVVALDSSPHMLTTVTNEANARRLRNIATCRAAAERLPFAAHEFDVVATRYSAHHWRNLPAALGEMQRVVKPDGYVLIIDLEGEEDPLVDTHLQAMELLRDLSHVRDRAPSEWMRLLAAAGFTRVRHQSWPTRLEFHSWVTRMRTPADRVAVIRALQQQAANDVTTALAIEEDGSFTARTGLWWGRAPTDA
ncbi:MAG: SAM-dependent methyltransferase [Candidimonas sp.]|nr:MAG: SAM-dependent methyltransferase [Candidimonas sp.]